MQTKSRENGDFSFDDVPGGDYELQLSAIGFIKQEMPITIRENVAPPLITVTLEVGRIPDPETCGRSYSVAYRLQDNAAVPHLTGVLRDFQNLSPVNMRCESYRQVTGH